MKTLLHKNPFTRKRLMVFSSIAALVVGTVAPMSVQAAQLNDRELTLEDSAASATTGHNYSFQIATADNNGELRFQYCANNPFPGQSCTAPSGLDVSSVSLDGNVFVNGSAATNSYTIDTTNTTTNEIVIDTATANSFSSGDTIEVDFDGAVNPDSANTEYFVRLYTYTDESGGTKVDDGGLAFSTAETIDVTARVEENLVFCVYATGNSCSSPGTTSVDLGVLTTSSAKTASHQAEVATNALNGFTIQYAGTTLTHSNGTDTISAIGASGTSSSPGTEQFGMNLTLNNSPSNAATIDSDYDAGSSVYAFVDGATVTDGEEQTQDGGTNPDNTVAYATGPVDTNVFDVEYLGNVGATTPTGAYSTTVTYVATATF